MTSSLRSAKKRAPLCLLLSLSLLYLASPALATSEGSEVIAEIERRYRTVTSISGEFNQVMPLEGMGITREARGVFYIKKPGKSRWEYAEPVRQVFIVNGEFLYFKKEKDESFRETKISAHLIGIYNVLLGGEGNLPELFEFSRVETDGESYAKVELVPLEKLKRDVRRIVLTWNRKSKLVEELTIFSLTGTSNTLSFSRVEVNRPISSLLFRIQ
ncbi:MAG: hypothetical protein GTN70_07390 [Deltaproteobacteria bacterium]|nr:hypothetical protein [Deltaproteobacteria bacterium]